MIYNITFQIKDLTFLLIWVTIIKAMIDRYDLRLDYDSHPNYNKVRTLSFSSTFSFLLLFLFSTIKTIIFTLFGKLYPKVPSGKSKIYDNFYKAGVYALNDKQIVSQINNDIKDTISVHIKNVKKIDPSARTLSNCVEGFRRKQNPVLFDKISDSIFSNNVFKEIHREFFNKKNAPLRYVLMHYNQENDIAAFKHGKEDFFDDDLNFYHHDTNLNTLKVMVYLSSLKKIEHGAFEYVEGSNHIWNYFDFIISRVNRKLATYRRDLAGKKKTDDAAEFFS